MGRIQTRTYDDTNGQKHYITEVIIEEVYFADSNKNNNSTENNATDDQFEIIDSDSLPF